jgi:hypothetical protein
MLRYLFPLLLIASSSFGQEVDKRINDVEGIMRDVVTLDSLPQQTVHDGIIRWIKTNYNKPNEVLILDELGLIRVRESVSLSVSGVSCSVSTDWEVKDGRVRITMGQYDCISSYGNFNALQGIRTKKGTVKFGYSAHHDWIVNSFNRKVEGVQSLSLKKTEKEDW